MRIARPLGISADGDLLIVATDDGEQLGIPADERLRAALRRDRPRLGQLEIDMDSALRPREIQQRIRSGQSLDEVARAAGVPVEKVEPFAVPVLAERAHVAGVALASSVRRRGETHSQRTLRQAVADRLLQRGIDADTVEWDAWRGEDRRWTVRGAYHSGSADREALFLFDLAGRFSTSVNDDARWLLGEPSPATGPQPGRRGHRVDDSDELALVRVVSDEDEAPSADSPASPESPGSAPSADGADSPESAGSPESPAAAAGPGRDATDPRTPAVPPTGRNVTPAARSGASPQEIGEEVEAELDAFDVIPEGRSELDVLYDMLGGINEDSINVYAGLDRPVVDDEPPAQEDSAEADEKADESTADEPTTDEPTPRPTGDEPAENAAPDRKAPNQGTADQKAPEGERADGQPADGQPVDRARTSEQPADDEPVGEQPAGEPPTDDAPAARQRRAPRREPRVPGALDPARARERARALEDADPAAGPREPEQPSLVDDDEPAKRPARRPRKKGRASVPSWDEIMFGGPQQPKG